MKKPKKRRLTAKLVAKLLKRGPGRYRDHSEHVRGLMLVVVNENNASWQLRYEQNGRERWHGLGPVREFKLQEARERAREARQKLREGIDPIEAKKKAKADTALAAAQTMTFQEAADSLLINTPVNGRMQNTEHNSSPRYGLMPILSLALCRCA